MCVCVYIVHSHTFILTQRSSYCNNVRVVLYIVEKVEVYRNAHRLYPISHPGFSRQDKKAEKEQQITHSLIEHFSKVVKL